MRLHFFFLKQYVLRSVPNRGHFFHFFKHFFFCHVCKPPYHLFRIKNSQIFHLLCAQWHRPLVRAAVRAERRRHGPRHTVRRAEIRPYLFPHRAKIVFICFCQAYAFSFPHRRKPLARKQPVQPRRLPRMPKKESAPAFLFCFAPKGSFLPVLHSLFSLPFSFHVALI